MERQIRRRFSYVRMETAIRVTPVAVFFFHRKRCVRSIFLPLLCFSSSFYYSLYSPSRFQFLIIFRYQDLLSIYRIILFIFFEIFYVIPIFIYLIFSYGAFFFKLAKFGISFLTVILLIFLFFCFFSFLKVVLY